MDNTLINIRFIDWHFIVYITWKMEITRNRYHKQNGYPDGYFRVYRFFNYEK